MERAEKHGILVAVDESEATDKTLRYVAQVVGGRRDFRVRLLHLLPLVPPVYLEHGGAESPAKEERLEKETRELRRRWIADAKEKAQPVFEHAKEVLGLPEEMVETEFRSSVDAVAVARDCMEAAADSGCRTIAVGREALPWHRELFHKHHCDELVKHARDVTIWVVE